MPVLPKGQNKLPFKAPEMQRLCKRHARKTVTRPTADIYREPRSIGSWELSLYFAKKQQGVGHRASYGSQAQHRTLSSANSQQGKQTFTGRELKQFRVSPAPLALFNQRVCPEATNNCWVHNSSVAQCKRRFCAPSGLILLCQNSPRYASLFLFGSPR